MKPADVSPPTLAHDVLGSGTRRVLFLHGILGSRTNWKGFARRLVESAPPWSACIADLRNHGDSRGFAGPHDMHACVADVARLAAAQGPFDLVVGHSFGGKVALAWALAHPNTLAEAWILDAPPGLRTFDVGGREEITRVFTAVQAVPLPVSSRKALVDTLRAEGLSDPVAQWMTTNLTPVPGGFGWRFDLAAVTAMLASFGALDLWPPLELHAAPPRIVMVRGGRSDRWSADDRARLVRAAAVGAIEERVLNDAGHWLHTDDPTGLWALLEPALQRVERGGDG